MLYECNRRTIIILQVRNISETITSPELMSCGKDLPKCLDSSSEVDCDLSTG